MTMNHPGQFKVYRATESDPEQTSTNQDVVGK